MPKTALHLRLAKALELIGDQGHPQDQYGMPERNAPSPLKVFIPFIGQRKERQLRRMEAQETLQGDQETAISLAADELWHDSGFKVSKGDAITISARGRLFLSKPLEVSVGAKTCLWFRIGAGEIQRCASDQHHFTADAEGTLELQAALPGAFDSPNGRLSAEPPPPKMHGTLQVSIRHDDSAPAAPRPPKGWQYLWRLGDAAIFDQSDDAICCHTHGDVGILQHPVDIPLSENTELSWDWLVESLPSSLPEHIQPTHDYLSIAVEFDNGLDLTYMWSSELPTDTIFQCPLPYWDKRETHWVLRNAKQHSLQQWLSESRQLLQDYKRAIGGELPSKVVKIWLIANSAFQSGQGVCRYRNIAVGESGSLVYVHHSG